MRVGGICIIMWREGEGRELDDVLFAQAGKGKGEL